MCLLRICLVFNTNSYIKLMSEQLVVNYNKLPLILLYKLMAVIVTLENVFRKGWHLEWLECDSSLIIHLLYNSRLSVPWRFTDSYIVTQSWMECKFALLVPSGNKTRLLTGQLILFYIVQISLGGIIPQLAWYSSFNF